MRHFATASFWGLYEKLSSQVKSLADKNFKLIKLDPRHPSLQLKKAGKYWSARVGLHYRVIGTEVDEGIAWFWIGSHADYDRLIK